MKVINLNNKEYCITSKELNKMFYFMSEAKDKQFFEKIASNSDFYFISLSYISNIRFAKNNILIYFGCSPKYDPLFKTSFSFLQICKLTYEYRTLEI